MTISMKCRSLSLEQATRLFLTCFAFLSKAFTSNTIWLGLHEGDKVLTSKVRSQYLRYSYTSRGLEQIGIQ